MHKSKHIMIFYTAIVILIFVAAFQFLSLWRSKNSLCTSIYSVCAKGITIPIRIVQLTDIHNSEFGEGNIELVEAVEEQQPDLILITGDILDLGSEKTEVATDLITQLCEVAPMYISLGNHEIEYEERYGVDITALYEAAGATVLEYSYEDIAVNGQFIRLGGIYGYCLPEKYVETGEANTEECAFLDDFMDTDTYTILMCHMPVCWIQNDGLNEWDVNFVLAGHAHGGQVRIPFIGGLYAPDQGWFVGREEGLYYSKDNSSIMVLSRGLGSGHLVPRINNKPQIVVVDLLPEE